ncbi:MAG: PIN domain-containing protein [Gammaproteobacteria bacterium]
MEVLVDTSIWIDYFRSGKHSKCLDNLLDDNRVVINDIILAELMPYLRIKKQNSVIELLNLVKRLPVRIDWAEIIEFQTQCLQSGANGVGIPDLLIAQNAIQYRCELYSLDKHFRLLSPLIGLEWFLCEE